MSETQKQALTTDEAPRPYRQNPEWLSDWEVAALEKAVEAYAPMIEQRCAAALLEKLKAAKAIKIVYPADARVP
jgi:hypothetical protein